MALRPVKSEMFMYDNLPYFYFYDNFIMALPNPSEPNQRYTYRSYKFNQVRNVKLITRNNFEA
jgi:hypothetical protein